MEVSKTSVKKSEIKGGIKKPVSNLQRKLIMSSKTRQAISQAMEKFDRDCHNLELRLAAKEDDVSLGVKVHLPDFSERGDSHQGRKNSKRGNEVGSMEVEGRCGRKGGRFTWDLTGFSYLIFF